MNLRSQNSIGKNVMKIIGSSKQKKIKNKELWEQYDTTIGCQTIKGPESSEHYAILNIPEVVKKLF